MQLPLTGRKTRYEIAQEPSLVYACHSTDCQHITSSAFSLRADAVESITCGYLSSVVALGLIVQVAMPGWWWIDSVASLAIVVLLVKEGHEALQVDECA